MSKFCKVPLNCAKCFNLNFRKNDWIFRKNSGLNFWQKFAYFLMKICKICANFVQLLQISWNFSWITGDFENALKKWCFGCKNWRWYSRERASECAVDERPRRACRANSVPGCAECLRRIFNADGTIIGIWFSWPNRTWNNSKSKKLRLTWILKTDARTDQLVVVIIDMSCKWSLMRN